MIDVFEARFLPGLKAREGGATFTNRSADRGGPTKFGITAETLGRWRKLGRPATADEVKALTEGEADRIYRADYYLRPGFDRVAAVSPRIAEELIDTGVNMGPERPCRWMQESLNVLNRQGRDWPDIAVDGELGPVTLSALRSLLARRGQRGGEDLMLKCLNGLQFGAYWAIATSGGPNGDQEANVVGWIAQRIGAIA